ncbi:hypothetical protein ASF27_14735 [Methylobacterium sp. Leaf102]|nr:hypothetical protein ASF27_14735 [Methylobacterium sp. Leaf102]
MEIQVKHAIFCELKRAVARTRELKAPRRLYGPGREDITTVEDIYLPDSWGILMQLTLQVDEKMALTPGVITKDPIDNALTGFRIGLASTPQSFTLGVGGNLTLQNQRIDRYNTYYAVRDLAIPNNNSSGCVQNSPRILGEKTTGSSPFIDATGLGIGEWLSSAARVIAYHPSSRVAEDSSGPPIAAGTGANASDASTYTNKFIITTGASVTPTWNLIRIGTATSSLYDTSRIRTHELILTVGPGAIQRTKTRLGQSVSVVSPAAGVANAQLAAQIGSAVASAVGR